MRKLALCLATALFTCSVSVWAQAANPQPAAPKDPAAAQAPVAGQGQSQSWNGTLADATCKGKDQNAKCPCEAATTAFGIVASDGKFYKFDDAGNTAAAAEMKKASNKSGDILVVVTGAADGDIIKVQTFQLQ